MCCVEHIYMWRGCDLPLFITIAIAIVVAVDLSLQGQQLQLHREMAGCLTPPRSRLFRCAALSSEPAISHLHAHPILAMWICTCCRPCSQHMRRNHKAVAQPKYLPACHLGPRRAKLFCVPDSRSAMPLWEDSGELASKRPERVRRGIAAKFAEQENAGRERLIHGVMEAQNAGFGNYLGFLDA